MKVLLKKDVDNLGYAGEVMKVADGYGRNYLIPQELAVKATPSVLKEAAAWRDRAASRMAELRKEHEALAQRIARAQLEFTALAGDTGKLYGSVTTNDVVEKLNEELGTDIDRRNVVGEPLRQLGEHRVTVRLSRDYQPQVKVIIYAEGAESEEEISLEDTETEAEQAESGEVAAEIESEDSVEALVEGEVEAMMEGDVDLAD